MTPPPDVPPENRRRFERVSCQIPVRYRFRAQGLLTSWQEMEAGNISAGGLFITVGEKIEAGAVLELEIPVPGLVGPLKVTARVAWSKPGPVTECGLEFTDIKPADRKFLEVYVSRAPRRG